MFDPWMALALTAVVLCLISTPLFRSAGAPPADGPGRQNSIDGLRGFAAFGVFLHHALIERGYMARGVWELPPSRFFSMAGQVGVAVFFLITGYLFWTKMLRERGRPDWMALYVGRVFRIAPVYALAMAGLFLAVAIDSGFRLEEELPALGQQVARWMSLGILSGGPINGDVRTGVFLAGVTWSLQYEWAFYAALLALSPGARRAGWALPFTGAAAAGCLAWRYAGGPYWLGPSDPVFALLFVAGMACATLDQRSLLPRAPPWLLSAGCLAVTAATFRLFPSAYGVLPALLLGGAFALVLAGGDLFGLLRSEPARRLGDVSFGVYMLQGLALTLAFYPEAVRARALASGPVYWAVVLAAAVGLVAAATAAHRWLERPGIRGGRKLVGLIGRR